ncbi:hypothetical protein [uncultured Draconibacterium sp.]|uniref:hypothetical protein n=1 Tax=uncultured Draconibacterium sp. TaxID=1573823 RepID=UPI002AA6BF37|nr:hypothetical protein [uncultured Draconibacterium sp.]
MPDREDYDACYDAFMAIPAEEVKAPEIPVESAIQENENLYLWSLDDKDALMAAGLPDYWMTGDATVPTAPGLPETSIDSLTARNGACRTAEALWKREQHTPQDAQKEWEERAPAAYELHDRLLHDFRYAFRNNQQLLNRVSDISDGTGDADMIQDLSNLAALGEANPEPLALINFDVTLLQLAATTADELAIVLAQANGEKEIDSQVKITRDRAYTYMKQAADEIKNCGRYVFWKNEARLKGYRNIYRNKTYNRNKSGDNTDSGE